MGTYSTASLVGAAVSVPPSGVIANVTFSNLTRGSGITAVSQNGEYASQDFSTSSTLNTANNDYLEFTITPSSCFKMNLSAVRFSFYRGSSGPTNVVLRSSLDGYTTNIGGVLAPNNGSPTTQSISLAAAAYQNLTSAITFRLYGYNSSAANGSLRIVDANGDKGVEFDGTVVSNAPSALTYTNNTPTYCVGVAITNNSPSNNGGAPTSYSVSPALPAGLSLNPVTGVISGTPTIATAVNNYTVTATNGCGSTTKVLTIAVVAQVTSLSYTTSTNTYCTGNAIATNSPTVNGGGTITYSVSPALPTGLTLNATGTITGTPTVATAANNYTVTATNGCSSAQAVLNITVIIGVSSLNYTNNTPTYCVNVPISTNSASITGGGTITYSVSPALPVGLSLNAGTGAITGTPTAVTASASYTVTATNGCSSTTKVLTIAVVASVTSLSYTTSTNTYCTSNAITQNTASAVGGGTITYSVSPALPAGLNLNPGTGAITGTPTVATAANNYTVTASNGCSSAQAVLNITVITGVSSLNYTNNTPTYCVNVPISTNSASITGGGTITYSVSPALPVGLNLNPGTGAITGTPTAVTASAPYTVTATNGCSSTTKVLTIAVVASVTSLSYTTSTNTYCTNNTITANNPTVTGGGTITYSISSALPAGLNFNTSTGAITGTPTATSPSTNYTVTASNGCSSAQVVLNITVITGVSGLSYNSSTITACVNTPVTDNVSAITGGGTITYSVSPALPAGVSINANNGTISGTPTTATATANYTVTATNGCSSTTVSITITINYNLNGNYNVGVGQTFTTLTAAVTAYNSACLSGPVAFLLTDASYNGSETFPITINSNSNASSTNTLTIKPNTGVNSSITSGSSTSSLIQFNGAKYVTIDGANTLGGTTNNLTISNTNTGTTSSAVTFINGAINDNIKYTTLQALGSSLSTGVIVFGTAGATGNNNNTITSCNIDGGAGGNASPSSVAVIGIYSSGSSTGTPNSNNTISNNNIFNNYGKASNAYGIYLFNSSAWIVTGNKFYQTSTRTATANNNFDEAINIDCSSAGGFTVSNNTIGYAASSATGTTIYNGNFTNYFYGIELNVSKSTASNVQGNIITAISLTTVDGDFYGIAIDDGLVNIGTTTGNTIGASSGTNSITINNPSGVNTYIRPIYSGASVTITIQNNIISSIGTAAGSNGCQFWGIYADANIPSCTISSNTLGSSTADAIRIGTSGSTTTQALVYGIYTRNFSGQTITGNTLNNLSAYSTSSSTQLFGINTDIGSAISITGNTISNLTTTEGSANTISISGIYADIATSSQTINNNIIFGLKNTSTSSASGVVGVYLDNIFNLSSVTGTVYQNKIYKLESVGNATPIIDGVYINGGKWTIYNNMISVINGSNTNAAYLFGIFDDASFYWGNPAIQYYFNSIYIGGTASSGSLNSSCYYRDYDIDFFNTYHTSTVTIKDNIFVNARTGGTGTHYAIENTYPRTPSNWTSDYNIFNAPTTTIGLWNATNETFANWKTASSGDNNSYSGITGTSGNYVTFSDPANGDLHLDPSKNCIANGNGIAITSPSITVDYDNQIRGNPPDIGADEFTSTFSTIASISGANAVCVGSSITLTGSPVSGTWSSSDITKATVNSSSGQVTGVAVGSVTISYLYTLGSCSSTANYGVTVNPLPSATFSGSSTINTCYGSTATLTINGTANANIAYTINGVAQTPVTLNGAGTATITTGAITSTTTYILTNASLVATGCSQNLTASNTITISVTAGSFTWTGLVSSDWNNSNNWCSNTLPGNGSAVIIPSGTPNPCKIFTADATANSVIINSGATLTMQNNYNLIISSGGFFENDGIAASFDGSASTGAVIFSSPAGGTIKGTSATTFNNVTINGNLTLTKAPTINGNFQINSGAVLTNSPTYTSTSTLIYNVTGSYTNGLEWNGWSTAPITAGSSIPQNVAIQSGTVIIPNSGGANRSLAGNLTIGSGTTLQMTAGTRDLYVAGNWTNSAGTFTASTRKVILSAIGTSLVPVTQTITGTTTFYDLTFGNSFVTTDFGSSSINILDNLRNDAGSMNGNTSTVNFNGASGLILGTASKYFYNLSINTSVVDNVASTGDIHIDNSFTNNGTFSQLSIHTIYFDKSGATETLSGTGSTTFGKVTIGGPNLSFPTTLNAGSHNFTVTGGSFAFTVGSIFNGNTGTVTFLTAAASVSGTGTANFYNAITNVGFDPGSGISTFNNNLQLNPGGSITNNHPPFYGNTATLTYNTASAALNTNIEWTNNTLTPGGLGAPKNVTLQNDNIILLSVAGSRTVPGTLTINNGSTLAINGNTLSVNSGFAGTGNLKGSITSNLIAGGTGTIYFNALANYLKNLTINNAANLSLGSALNITASNGSAANTFGTVTVGSGAAAALDATNNGYLNLKSDTYGDAIVAQSSGTINGNVTVERYIPKTQRAWRFLSMPFNATSTQTLNQAWQEGAMPYPQADNSSYSSNILYNPKPGYGTEITFDNYTGNGFDVNITYNPSLKIWDYSTKTWSTYAPHTNTTKIIDYPAYCLFVRGDRSVNLVQGTGAPVLATTLRATGKLNENGASVSSPSVSLANNDFLFVGNPFASPVDFSLLQKNNVNANYFYVWDPKIGGTGNGVGAYVAYSYVNPVGWSITTGGSYTATTPPVLQSGQAFFVQAIAPGNTSVTFPQSSKNTTEFSTSKHQPIPALFAQLVLPNDSMKLTDGITAVFGDNFSAGRDEFDVPKMWNIKENMALQRGTDFFVIETMPVPKLTDTIFLKLYLYKDTAYALKIFSINFTNMPPVRTWLVDKYLNTKTEINLNDTTLYNFTPNPDTNSYRNRFMLVFNRQLVTNPVPVTKAINQNDPNITGIANNIISGSISIMPNPVSTAKNARLYFNNILKGEYEVIIYSTEGQKLVTKKIQHDGGKTAYALPAAPSFAAGVYTVSVIDENGNQVTNLKLVIIR